MKTFWSSHTEHAHIYDKSYKYHTPYKGYKRGGVSFDVVLLLISLSKSAMHSSLLAVAFLVVLGTAAGQDDSLTCSTLAVQRDDAPISGKPASSCCH